MTLHARSPLLATSVTSVRPSVRLFVCLSVRLTDCDQVVQQKVESEHDGIGRYLCVQKSTRIH